MALTRQTLTLISISALLFSTIFAKETSSPTASPTATPGALSHLFDKLPSFGIKKAEVTTKGEGHNVVTKQLEAMEQKIQGNRVNDLYASASPDVPEPKRKCYTKCAEIYQSASGHAREGIALVNKKDLAKAKVEIGAVSTDVDKCCNCFKENKLDDPETKSLQEWVKGVTEDCIKNLN